MKLTDYGNNMPTFFKVK